MATKQHAKPPAKKAAAAPAPSAMHVEMMPILSVRAYGKNPRIIPDSAIDKVASSIKEFGFRQSIVVDEHMTIIAGHTRLMAAAKLGMTHVPVHVARGLTKTQVKAYRLADNRVSQESSWEMQILGEELGDLRRDDFDLDLTGFDPSELVDLFPEPDVALAEDDADLTPPAIPTTKRGDVYQLGPHRLMCGDAIDASAWGTLMQEKQADLVWTDPPYGVSYESKNEDLKGWNGRLGRPSHASQVTNDTMTGAQLEDLLRAALGLAWANVRDGAAFYVAAPSGPPQFQFLMVLTELKLVRQILVWVKNTFVLGRSDYHYRHEQIFYGWKEGAAHYFIDDRTQDTVWEIPRPRRSEEHPTMKPVALVQRAIENSSTKGQLVVDPFAGSGTTLIAAEQTGRTAYLMEIDPRYCDVIIRRWEKVSGETAVLL